jgi:putative MATE family efflux protein
MPVKLRRFIHIGWPVSLGLALSTLLGIVDLGFVSTLGKSAVAGVGLVGTIYWLLTILPDLFGAGVLAAVARAFGRNDRGEAGSALRTGLNGAWALSIFVAAVGFFLAPYIVSLFDVEPVVFNIGVSFFRITLLSFPFLATTFIANSALYGAGYTYIPLIVMGGANIINIALNPCLILGLGPFPRLGTDGSALATLISTFLAATAIVIYLQSHHSPMKPFGRNRGRGGEPWLGRLIKVGGNAAAQSLMRPLTATFMYRIVAAFGTTALASFAIGVRCLNFTFIFTMGLNTATSALVGQALGRADLAEARQVSKLAIKTTLLIQVCLSLIYYLGADMIISIFNTTGDSGVAVAGVDYLQKVAIGMLLGFVAFPIGAIFRGAGDTAPPMWSAFIANWPVKLGLAYILSGLFFTDFPAIAHSLGGGINWGINGIWWAIAASLITEGWVLWLFFRRGKWQHKMI